ncbi:SCAN domain-containing protein 3-like, partial [Tachysurus ichikawai]
MGSEHKGLLLHTEVRWLSQGDVLRRLYELRDEVRIFLTDQRSPLAKHLSDPDWVTRLAYLSCIFEKLNGLNVPARSPFSVTTANHLASDMEDALIELSTDQTLRTAFDGKTLDEFWVSVALEYPQLSKAALDVLMQFGSTYLCEKTFSALTYIRNKYRSRLNVEDDLRVAISKIKPRVDLLCSAHSAHPSH